MDWLEQINLAKQLAHEAHEFRNPNEVFVVYGDMPISVSYALGAIKHDRFLARSHAIPVIHLLTGNTLKDELDKLEFHNFVVEFIDEYLKIYGVDTSNTILKRPQR